MSHIVPSTPAPQPPQQATAPLAASPLVSSPPITLQLLLSQAVCKLGTGAGWSSISQLVESSEEWPENAAKMTQQGYESAFNELMGVRGLDASACSQPQARPVRKLIHSLYSELLVSLRDQILSSHAQEMKLKSEIQQISSGSVDNLLFNSASQPIKEKLLENQRSKDQEEVARRGQEQPQTVQESIPSETTSAQPIAPQPTDGNVSKPEEIGAGSTAQPPDEAESVNQPVADQRDVSMKDPEGETTNAPSQEEVQEAGDATVEAEEEEVEGGEEEEEEKSPTKKRARRTAGGGRRGRKRTTTGGRGRAKKEVAATEENAEEEEAEGEGEEEENQEGEDGGEEEEEGEGEEGAAAEEEEGEQDEKKPASSRKRGPPSRKGSRTTKRKASEPTPPTTDSPAAGEGENAAPATKRTKRGGRKSRADTEAEQEGTTDSTESKESKQLTARRKTAYTRILETIRTSLPFSSSFDTKVTKSQAPNYSAAVQRPTCLRDIGKKIKNGEIKDNSELMREFAIMCANAVQFNGIEGEVSVGRQAQELWEAFEREMNATLSTEFLVENSST
ncbi:hypothetical protein JCM5350_004410 [Sporobolomyces pararoseus]